MLKLNDDDGRAVDMLLDTSGSSNGNGNGHAFSAAPAPFRQRLDTVESILNLLKEMPTTEPPRNLVAKTLQTIATRAKKRPRRFTPRQTDQPQDRRPQA